MREGIGDARGWDVGLRSIYRRGAFNYLVQPCLGHVGCASARDVLDDLNGSEDECYGSMLVDIGFLVGFVKFISYGDGDGDNDGDDDGDGRSSMHEAVCSILGVAWRKHSAVISAHHAPLSLVSS